MKPLLFLLMAGLAGCATRTLTKAFPKGAPASPAAAPAPPAALTRSLREDPPLPGDDVTGWAGLEPEESRRDAPADAGDASREGHRHHAP